MLPRLCNRDISLADLFPGTVSGLQRTWTAPAEVTVTDGEKTFPATGLFLDLTVKADATCNGVLFEVTDEEMQRLDMRERLYLRVPIQAVTARRTIPGFTYVVPERDKVREGIVLEKYTSLIKDALTLYSPDFQQQFWQGTEPAPLPLTRGSYIFSNPEQDSAAKGK